jgi:hypothetical protein
MLVIIDGQKIKVENDVKIIYESFDPDEPVDLHVTMTSEGMIQDLVQDGEVIDSHAEEVLNIAEKFIG